jgi:hypothetical protein
VVEALREPPIFATRTGDVPNFLYARAAKPG